MWSLLRSGEEGVSPAAPDRLQRALAVSPHRWVAALFTLFPHEFEGSRQIHEYPADAAIDAAHAPPAVSHAEHFETGNCFTHCHLPSGSLTRPRDKEQPGGMVNEIGSMAVNVLQQPEFDLKARVDRLPLVPLGIVCEAGVKQIETNEVFNLEGLFHQRSKRCRPEKVKRWGNFLFVRRRRVAAAMHARHEPASRVFCNGRKNRLEFVGSVAIQHAGQTKAKIGLGRRCIEPVGIFETHGDAPEGSHIRQGAASFGEASRVRIKALSFHAREADQARAQNRAAQPDARTATHIQNPNLLPAFAFQLAQLGADGGPDSFIAIRIGLRDALRASLVILGSIAGFGG